MAINFTDFSQAPIQGNAAANIFEDILKGYKMQREPAKMATEQDTAESEAGLKKLELKNKPAQIELERQYKEALINKANSIAKNGGKTATPLKPNSAVANAEYIWQKQHPDGDKTPEEVEAHNKALTDAFEVGQDATKSTAARRKQIMNSEFYNKLPAASKAQQLALAAGLGIDPAEASKAYENEGKTFSDLAKEKGVDPKSVIPVYPSPNENIKQYQIKSSLVAELGSLENNLKDVQADVAQKFLGYSPRQIVGALRNKSPQEQGMILAARALQPELAALRGRIALPGSTLGIEALKEIEDKSLANLKIFEPLVTKEARREMDKYLNQWIKEAASTYNGKLVSFSQIQGSPNQANIVPNSQVMGNALANEGAQKDLVYNTKTGRLE